MGCSISRVLHVVCSPVSRPPSQHLPTLESNAIALTTSERDYVGIFSSKAPGVEIDDRVEGTCVWSIEAPDYVSWTRTDSSAILWLTGSAGCGKTVLTNFLVRHLESQCQDRPSTSRAAVFHFFFVREVEIRRDVRHLLRTLIAQLFRSEQGLIRHIKRKFRADNYDINQSFETLWNIFQAAIEGSLHEEIYIVIDALDECDEKLRDRLLTRISRSQRAVTQANPSPRKRVKYLISGHWAPRNKAKSSTTDAQYFYIDVEKRPNGLIEDLTRYVDHRVENLVEKSICTEASGELIRQNLRSYTGNSFLWLKVVFDNFETSLSSRVSKDDIENTLNAMPRNLEDAYTAYLLRLKESQLPVMQKYLHLIVASTRPLSLLEMDAFTDLRRHPLGAAIPVDELLATENSIRRAFGPLVRFPEGRVNLVHSTAKDFFILLNHNKSSPLHNTHSVDVVSAHRSCAIACMRYLLDDRMPVDLFEASSSGLESFTASPTSPESRQTSNQRNETDNNLCNELPLLPSSQSPEETDDDAADDMLSIGNAEFLWDADAILEARCTAIRNKFPAIGYAAQNWPYHLHCCEAIADDHTIEDALSLLSGTSSGSNSWYTFIVQQSRIDMPPWPDSTPLVLAAFFDLGRVVGTLLNRQSLISDDPQLHDALFWAASKGSCDSIRTLLKQGVPVQRADSDQVPLAVATRGDFTEACQLLLAAESVDPNKADRDGNPPISLAVRQNSSEVLRSLLGHELLDVGMAELAGRTALSEACRVGAFDCVAMLREDGRSDINTNDGRGRTPLHHATLSGNESIVKNLLADPRLDVHMTDRGGRNALSLAAEHGHLTIIKRLHGKQVSATARDCHGRNAISWAANSTQAAARVGNGESALKYLVRKYPEALDDPDESGWTPLAWTLERPGYTQAVKVLLASERVDINRKDQTNGRSYLMWAASEGFVDIVRILLSTPGIDKKARSDLGRSALSYAASNGMREVVEILLADSEVSVDEKDTYGRGPADWARWNEHEQVAKLIEARAGR